MNISDQIGFELISDLKRLNQNPSFNVFVVLIIIEISTRLTLKDFTNTNMTTLHCETIFISSHGFSQISLRD